MAELGTVATVNSPRSLSFVLSVSLGRLVGTPVLFGGSGVKVVTASVRWVDLKKAGRRSCLEHCHISRVTVNSMCGFLSIGIYAKETRFEQ